MGVTPLIWKSLDRISKSWNRICAAPIEWDASKRIFRYNRMSKKLIPWAIAINLGALLLVLITFLLAIAPLAGLEPLSLTKYFVNIFWLRSFSSVLVIGDPVALAYGQDAVPAMNNLIFLYRALEQSEKFHTCNFKILFNAFLQTYFFIQ